MREQLDMLSAELQRLFTLQDRPITEAKLKIFVEELEKSQIPEACILLGIRSLIAEDLKAIKVITVLNAARKFVEEEPDHRVDCDVCFKTGGVPVTYQISNLLYTGILGCRCENGQSLTKIHGLISWNGEDVQMGKNGRVYTRMFKGATA